MTNFAALELPGDFTPGEEALLDCLERNETPGIVYHREGINGDYDNFDGVGALIHFIQTGQRR